MTKTYRLAVNGETVEVELERVGESSVLRVNGASYPIECTALDAHGWLLRVGEQLCRAYVLANGVDEAQVFVDGRVYRLEDVTQGRPSRRSYVGAVGGADTVTPATPAVVDRILVAVGEPVEKGQTLVVVTAMKMEMPLTAPYAGVVSALNTAVGANVAPGEILVEIAAAKKGSMTSRE
jgi:biotin carboxyl carrier protein